MLSFIYHRERGLHRPHVLRDAETTRMIYSIDLSTSKKFKSGHKAPILAMDIDITEQRYLLSGSSDGAINVFDLEKVLVPRPYTFEPIVSLNQQAGPNGKGAGVSSLQWYPHDTGIFATSSFAGFIYVWDANEEEQVRTFDVEGRVYSISMSPCATQHTLLAAGSADAKITLCDLKSGQAIWKLSGHTSSVLSVKWSPGAEYMLASGGSDGTIRLWDIRKFKSAKDRVVAEEKRKSLSPKAKVPKYTYLENEKKPDKAHAGVVTCITFTPDAMNLLSTGSDNKMRLWNVNDGTNTFVNYDKVVNSSKTCNTIAISSNGQLVYHPSDEKIEVYKLQNGEHITTLSNHFDKVNSCVFAPCGHELYSGGSDSLINIWEPHKDLSEEEGDETKETARQEGEDDRWSISEEDFH